MKRTLKVLILTGFLITISACTSFPKESDYLACDLRPVPIKPFLTPDNFKNESDKWLTSIRNKLAECKEDGNSFSVLSLSGGGPNGAYGAGFLSRRIRSGENLHPCLVTGVSTGAVMGSYVYLATSKNPETRDKYLPKLESFYQGLDDNNLVSKYSILTLPFHVSMYDVSGIRSFLRNEANENLLKDIKVEYASSHRIFIVGATDIATGKFEIIDLTEYVFRNLDSLANPGVQSCYQAAIRASAAIPIAFPPVPIKDETTGERKVYVDGGVRHLMFMNASQLQQLAGNRALWIYGVVNNTFDLSGMKKSLTLMDAAQQNLRIASDQLYMDSAYAVDSVSDSIKANRNWATMLGNPKALECAQKLPHGKMFDPAYQTCLFELGRKQTNWSQKPWPVYTIESW